MFTRSPLSNSGPLYRRVDRLLSAGCALAIASEKCNERLTNSQISNFVLRLFSSQRKAASLKIQRFDRAQSGDFLRRIVAKENTDQTGKKKTEGLPDSWTTPGRHSDIFFTATTIWRMLFGYARLLLPIVRFCTAFTVNIITSPCFCGSEAYRSTPTWLPS